jgi:hypothetical protein
VLPSAAMSLVVLLLQLSPASAQGGELALIEEEAEEAGRHIGGPMFMLAYVLLAGLGVLTAVRTGAEE